MVTQACDSSRGVLSQMAAMKDMLDQYGPGGAAAAAAAAAMAAVSVPFEECARMHFMHGSFTMHGNIGGGTCAIHLACTQDA